MRQLSSRFLITVSTSEKQIPPLMELIPASLFFLCTVTAVSIFCSCKGNIQKAIYCVRQGLKGACLQTVFPPGLGFATLNLAPWALVCEVSTRPPPKAGTSLNSSLQVSGGQVRRSLDPVVWPFGVCFVL